MSRETVLVTSAGSIIAQGIIKSLNLANEQKDNPLRYQIIGTDMSPDAAGLYRADNGVLVPAATSADYTDYLVKLDRETLRQYL